MPTLKQRKAIKIAKDIIEGKRPMMPIGKVMLEAEYSKKTSESPTLLTKSKSWEKFLASIDETPIVDKWMSWALDSKDKRVALQAGENIMKLKGRFKEVFDVNLARQRAELFE